MFDKTTLRKTEVYLGAVDGVDTWQEANWQELQAGDIVRMFEPTGEPVVNDKGSVISNVSPCGIYVLSAQPRIEIDSFSSLEEAKVFLIQKLTQPATNDADNVKVEDTFYVSTEAGEVLEGSFTTLTENVEIVHD